MLWAGAAEGTSTTPMSRASAKRKAGSIHVSCDSVADKKKLTRGACISLRFYRNMPSYVVAKEHRRSSGPSQAAARRVRHGPGAVRSRGLDRLDADPGTWSRAADVRAPRLRGGVPLGRLRGDRQGGREGPSRAR